ncbi:phosphoribosylanthranilate isomerase [Macrococcoides canis]|uniref:phosphoribosylanthranilate isomerase n=1 Tax=Macrococcoides canis TaxID=1855823 RepID=UPI001B8ADD97|nr:phosphoribosylanthranilate isomerase [Macrococcus canis]QUR94331.1 phosphoribosylanthranilate isomerase [Macrococcus canis]
MYIKCCGIQSKEALETCDMYHADAIGFIHYPKSRRHVTLTQLAEMMTTAISADRVAVLVNPTLSLIQDVLNTGIDVIQLHGDESVEYIKTIKQHFNGIRLFKALPATEHLGQIIAAYKQCDIERFIIDTPSKQYGGTGQSFDWELLNQIHGNVDYLIAGGMTLNKIQTLNRKGYHNEGYDISSGIETDGQKDIQKIKTLLTTLKG